LSPFLHANSQFIFDEADVVVNVVVVVEVGDLIIFVVVVLVVVVVFLVVVVRTVVDVTTSIPVHARLHSLSLPPFRAQVIIQCGF
jgi:hypothetical protein